MNDTKSKSDVPNNQALKRRQFIRSAAVASGTFAIAKQSFAQAAEPLRIGIIGTGTQGQELMNACVKSDGIQVAALCDIWEAYNLKRTSTLLERFKQEHKTYTDYKQMLESEPKLDAVLIATPDNCHAEQTITCLNAGKHVYCESMMSNTADGARQMAKTANDTGKLLQIGFQRRSNPYYRYAFDHVINETKLLGQITATNSQWNRAVQTPRGFPRRAPVDEAVLKQNGYESMQQFRNWMWSKKHSCGPVGELGSHQFDVIDWYLGALPQSVRACGGQEYYNGNTYEWQDTVMGIFEYEAPKGHIHAFYQTINSNSNFGYFENFMGDQGTLYVSENLSRVKVYREPGAPDWDRWVQLGILNSPLEPPKKEEDGDDTKSILEVSETAIPPNYDFPLTFTDPLVKPHLDNFFDAIRGKAKLNCPPEIGFQNTIAVLKFNEAVETGKTIALSASDFQV